ncbi:MAG: hypothetical protein E7220_00040 [Clostridiales bacterium]|nr:hypothetical protein [Clostridiales bacterium]
MKIKLPESVRKLNTKKNKRRIILADYVLLALVIVILITARTPGEIDAVEVTSTSYNSVALKWDPVSNADGYHVYRSEDGKEYKYLTTAQTSAYEDKDLHTGTKYTYAIAPYNGIRRNGITDAPVAEATPELATPVLKGSVKKGMVDLKFKEVEGATGYEIYRNGKVISNQEALEFVDESAKNDKEYKYEVKAYRYKDEPVYSETSNKVDLELKGVSKLTADVLGTDLVFKWEPNEYYTSYKIKANKGEPETVEDTEYILKDFDPDEVYQITLVGVSEDGKTMSPENVQAFAIEGESMTNQQAIDAACDWAVDIANDNSFTYGTGDRAHRYGCYFCGTNVGPNKNIKGSSLVNGHSYEKTYCCNPFVHAAFAHGAGDPAMLYACQHGDGIAMSERSFTEYGNWKNVGKPSKGSLQRGDVLVRDDHVALYIGNGQDVQAVDKGWTDISISVFNLPQSTYDKFDFVMRYTGNGRGTSYTVHEVEIVDNADKADKTDSDKNDKNEKKEKNEENDTEDKDSDNE